MHHTLPLIGGVTVGAGLMFILDPDRGRRRRALMRDKSMRWSRKTREFAGSASRDVRNRAIGMGAMLKSWMQPGPPVPDHILAQRVRATLGMYSRHPSAIDVHVTDGVVTLSGPVLDDEVDDMCTAIRRFAAWPRSLIAWSRMSHLTMFPRFKVIRGQNPARALR